MNEKDKKVVEAMCRTGMDFETLCSCFPKFSSEDLLEVAKKYNKNCEFENAPRVSINCS
jgi:hypothetical protein